MDCLQVLEIEVAGGDVFQHPLSDELAFDPVELIRISNAQPVSEDRGTGIDIGVVAHSAAGADTLAAVRFLDCSMI